MNPEKTHPTITTKPANPTGGHGKGISVEDEKVTLVKSGQSPAYMQRRMVGVDEEEKDKKHHKMMKSNTPTTKHY